MTAHELAMFSADGVRVTHSEFVYHYRTYAIADIEQIRVVRFPVERRPLILGAVLSVAMFASGVVSLLFEHRWLAAVPITVGFGATTVILVRAAIKKKPEYAILLRINGTEVRAADSTDERLVAGIHHAVTQAMAMRAPPA